MRSSLAPLFSLPSSLVPPLPFLLLLIDVLIFPVLITIISFSFSHFLSESSLPRWHRRRRCATRARQGDSLPRRVLHCVVLHGRPSFSLSSIFSFSRSCSYYDSLDGKKKLGLIIKMRAPPPSLPAARAVSGEARLCGGLGVCRPARPPPRGARCV